MVAAVAVCGKVLWVKLEKPTLLTKWRFHGESQRHSVMLGHCSCVVTDSCNWTNFSAFRITDWNALCCKYVHLCYKFHSSQWQIFKICNQYSMAPWTRPNMQYFVQPFTSDLLVNGYKVSKLGRNDATISKPMGTDSLCRKTLQTDVV